MTKSEKLKYLKLIKENLSPNLPYMCSSHACIGIYVLKDLELDKIWKEMGHVAYMYWELGNHNSSLYLSNKDYSKSYHKKLYLEKIKMINQRIKELES